MKETYVSEQNRLYPQLDEAANVALKGDTMTDLEFLRRTIKEWVGEKEEHDRALAIIDELEKAVTLTREWFDKGWWVPVVRSNGQDKMIPPGTIGPKTQAVMDAIKKVTS